MTLLLHSDLPRGLTGTAQVASTIKRLFRFYVNRFSIFYAGTGAVNALIIDGWLYVLTRYGALPLPVSTLIAVVTSIFTDYTWKSEVVFRSPLLSRGRFSKYFLNGSAATIIQYVLTLLLSTLIFYTVAYIFAVAVGFLFAYTISRLKIWYNFVPRLDRAAPQGEAVAFDEGSGGFVILFENWRRLDNAGEKEGQVPVALQTSEPSPQRGDPLLPLGDLDRSRPRLEPVPRPAARAIPGGHAPSSRIV